MCQLPSVRVVIPAKNEEEYIELCIDSLLDQNYPSYLIDIVVVDNGSTDHTAEIAANKGIDVITFPVGNIGKLRNVGAEDTDADVIVYLDADCKAKPDFIATGIQLLSSSAVAAVGGYPTAPEDGNWIETAWALGQKEGTFDTSILVTATLFIKTKYFNELNGFDESVAAGEDTDICARLIENNYKLLRSSDLNVIHYGYPKSAWSFIKRQVWQTSNYIQTLKSGKDPIFIATNIFMVSIFCAVTTSLFNLYFVSLLAVLFAVALSQALSLYRYHKSSEKLTVGKYIQVSALSLMYLFGRMTGLVKCYTRLLFKVLLKSN